MNPYSFFPFLNQLSSVCYTRLLLLQELIIQSTAIKILLCSASRMITQIPRLVRLYHGEKIWVNTHMCLHVTFKNLAVPEKLSNTSIQQPIKGFNIWCYAYRRRPFHYNGFIKYIMHRTFPCSRWRRNTTETGNHCSLISAIIIDLWSQWKRMYNDFFLARKKTNPPLGRTWLGTRREFTLYNVMGSLFCLKITVAKINISQTFKGLVAW